MHFFPNVILEWLLFNILMYIWTLTKRTSISSRVYFTQPIVCRLHRCKNRKKWNQQKFFAKTSVRRSIFADSKTSTTGLTEELDGTVQWQDSSTRLCDGKTHDNNFVLASLYWPIPRFVKNWWPIPRYVKKSMGLIGRFQKLALLL